MAAVAQGASRLGQTQRLGKRLRTVAGRDRLGECGDHVKEERLAERARPLGPVKDRDSGHGRPQRAEKGVDREGPGQAELEHADPFDAFGE